MKYLAILACLAAILCTASFALAWQEQRADRSDVYRRGVQSYGRPVHVQPSADGYAHAMGAETRQWQAYHQAQTQARRRNPQPTDGSLHVRAPRSPAANVVDYGRHGRGYVAEPMYQYPSHHDPYYSEQSQRDIIVEMVDWFLSIPASVVSRFAEAGNDDVYPNMPATHGSGQGNHYAAYSYQESDDAHFILPRSAYQPVRPR